MMVLSRKFVFDGKSQLYICANLIQVRRDEIYLDFRKQTREGGFYLPLLWNRDVYKRNCLSVSAHKPSLYGKSSSYFSYLVVGEKIFRCEVSENLTLRIFSTFFFFFFSKKKKHGLVAWQNFLSCAGLFWCNLVKLIARHYSQL